MSPSSRVAPPAPRPRRFGVLVVGTTNVCRSPAAERLLRAGLADTGGVVVTSAGTLAALGEPVPAPMADLLAAAGAPVLGHTARQLDADMVAAADLVLTVGRDERAAVVRAVPAAVRRTFTLRELARVAGVVGPDALPDGDAVDRWEALVAAAAPHRGPTRPRTAAEDDVLDPFGADEAAYATSFAQLRESVDVVVAAVAAHPADREGADEVDEARPVPVPMGPAVTRRRSRLRSALLVTTAGVVALVAAATVGALVVLGQADSRVERFPDPFAGLQDRPPAAVPLNGAAPVTVLVLGAAGDGRGGRTSDWAAAADRTETVMLAHISGDRRSAQVVSLPSDLQVDVPGAGRGALRSALAEGGPALAVQTVEDLTDVRVDHVALMDATTFARVTDTLGGVDVDVARDVVVDGEVLVPSGSHRLSGEQALAWSADTLPATDERLERQQRWLAAILRRMGDDDVRRDAGMWLRLLGTVTASVAVDETLDRSTLVGLATSVRGLRPGDVDVVAAPTTTSDGGAVVPDEAPFDELMTALRTDTLDEHLSQAASAG